MSSTVSAPCANASSTWYSSITKSYPTGRIFTRPTKVVVLKSAKKRRTLTCKKYKWTRNNTNICIYKEKIHICTIMNLIYIYISIHLHLTLTYNMCIYIYHKIVTEISHPHDSCVSSSPSGDRPDDVSLQWWTNPLWRGDRMLVNLPACKVPPWEMKP